jgi:hypothetical protein
VALEDQTVQEDLVVIEVHLQEALVEHLALLPQVLEELGMLVVWLDSIPQTEVCRVVRMQLVIQQRPVEPVQMDLLEQMEVHQQARLLEVQELLEVLVLQEVSV